MIASSSVVFQAVDSTVETLKEKLIKKTQLLEKAKILLSRAAAKEKNFREQVCVWEIIVSSSKLNHCRPFHR